MGKIRVKIKFPCGLEFQESRSEIAAAFKHDINKSSEAIKKEGCPIHGKKCRKYRR